jgi:hypothetical protein
MRITEPNYYRYYKTLGLFTKLATSYNSEAHELPSFVSMAILTAAMRALAYDTPRSR